MNSKNGTVAPEAEPVTEAKSEPKPKKKRKPAKSDMTLEQLAVAYVGQLEKDEKSAGTIFSYTQELRTALKELGAETKIASLTAKQVQTYFDCDRVTKLKTGKPKAQPSIDKTRRVLRLALVFAVQKKWLAEAPLPSKG
jgi:hypothetical protein